MNKKIIFQTKLNKELEIIIRYPDLSDAQIMMDYINKLSDERTFITYQGEHETLDSETAFLNSKLKEISEKKSVVLLAFYKDELIGISGIDMGTKTSRHIGLFGISIAKEYRGKGIGKILMNTIEREAIENLEGLEIIQLAAFASNEKALGLYKKFGYIEEGRLPKGVKLENGYDDHIYMYKIVK